MRALQRKKSCGEISLEDHLTLLYYRLTGPEEPRLVPVNKETDRPAGEYFRRFCAEFERVYGKDFLNRLRDGIMGDDEEREKTEAALTDDAAVLSLFDFASAQRTAPDEAIVARIKTSYEYGMEFLRAFNIIHEIIPDDSPIMEIAGNIIDDERGMVISEGVLPVLAASSASFQGEPGYVWHHKTLAGMESSLYRIGQDDYRFILHVGKGGAENQRIRITVKNHGNNETVLSAAYPKKSGSVILNYKGRIDEKTVITLKVHGVAREDA